MRALVLALLGFASCLGTAPPERAVTSRLVHVVAFTLEEDLAGAQDVLAALPAVGVDLDAITAELLTAGVQAFVDAYARLLEAVEQKRLQQVGG